jgi:hypothetical protein
MIFTFISLLVIGLIFSSSSFSSFYAFAKPKVKYGPVYCGAPPIGSDQVTCCQDQTDQTGLKITYCTDCDDTTPPSNCGPRYIPHEGGSVPPPVVSTEPPPAAPPKGRTPVTTGNTIEQPPTNLAPQPSSQTTTCPDGSSPDANGQCPPPTTGNQNPQSLNNNNGGSNGNSNTNNNNGNNNVQSQQQNNKGSNLLGHAGELAGNKKGSSPTPPPCPTDNSPIPPNCTLKPKF